MRPEGEMEEEEEEVEEEAGAGLVKMDKEEVMVQETCLFVYRGGHRQSSQFLYLNCHLQKACAAPGLLMSHHV